MPFPFTSTLAIGPSWLQPEYILERFGTWAFVAVLVIVFVECGLLMFFLPGDSLLFVTGLFIGAGTIDINIWLACILLIAAAIAGNISGYWIGRKSGPALFKNPDARFLTPANVEKTHAFFEKYEFQLAHMNRRLAPQVDTVFFMTDERNHYVSSSLVKEVAALGGDVTGLVPPAVVAALAAKRGR